MDFKYTDLPTINILNGDRFLISSRMGDIVEPSHGLFRHDTRFLSLFDMTINGQKLERLNSKNLTHYYSSFYLTNDCMPAVGKNDGAGISDRIPKHVPGTVDPQSIMVERNRVIESKSNEELTIINLASGDLDLELCFEVDADFLDLFEVKSRVYGDSHSSHQRKKKKVTSHFERSGNYFHYSMNDAETGFNAETLIWFSKKARASTPKKKKNPASVTARTASFDLTLKPGESFNMSIVVCPMLGREKTRKSLKNQLRPEHPQKEEEKLGNAANIWRMSVPVLQSNFEPLQHSYEEATVDILSLRMGDPTAQHRWQLVAGGCPWYMTLFGRDSLVTSYQTLLFGSALAKGTIEALSFYQAEKIDENRDAEPGKILHEMRYGNFAMKTNQFPYYGTVDATELFLILISEIYRWTADTAFVEDHRENMIRALSWIDEYGDSDKDGFIEYSRKTPMGLVNQCWKDSWDSIRFSNGKIAEGPIATCEVQGYVYDAKLRTSEIAREVWKDDSLAKKLFDEANELKELFNEKFWIEDKGYYALALDGEKRQVDSMTSNNGQVLSTGIAAEDKVNSVVKNLMAESMFSGFGIRTMSVKDLGYDPIGYHTGCIWAHDNSLIAKGLADYRKFEEAMDVIDSILDAASHFGYILPEAFAGFAKKNTIFPVRYPNACSPQGWASGALPLLLRTILGLSPSRSKRMLVADPIYLKESSRYGGIKIELEGLSAFGKRFNFRVTGEGKPEMEEVSSDKLIASGQNSATNPFGRTVASALRMTGRS